MPKLIPVEGHPYLGRRKPEGKIYFRKLVGSLGRVCISTGQVDVRAAAKVAQRLEVELIKRADTAPVVNFETFANSVYETKIPTWRENTRKSAKNHILSYLVPFFGKYPLDEITDEVWGRFVLHLHTKYPKRYLGNTRKYMRIILKRARNSGLTTKTLELAIPDRKRVAGKWFTQEEIEALLGASKPDLQIQILMGYLMGMRKMEILALTWDRVNFDKKTVYLGEDHTKTKRAREMAIPDKLLPILRERRLLSSIPYVFPLKDGRRGHVRSIEKNWQNARTAARVYGRFHDLRHSFLSETLLVKKMNPLHVSIYAGVSLKEIQKTYLHPDAETTRGIASAMRIRLPLRLVTGQQGSGQNAGHENGN